MHNPYLYSGSAKTSIFLAPGRQRKSLRPACEFQDSQRYTETVPSTNKTENQIKTRKIK